MTYTTVIKPSYLLNKDFLSSQVSPDYMLMHQYIECFRLKSLYRSLC
jgi:hypothetical protein